MTNPLKGEVDVVLGGETYKARLTVDALIGIETSIGCGIITLCNRIGQADIKISDVAIVLLAALRGGGNDLKQKDVYKIIQENGIVEVTTEVAKLITQSINPKDETDDESEVDSKKKG